MAKYAVINTQDFNKRDDLQGDPGAFVVYDFNREEPFKKNIKDLVGKIDYSSDVVVHEEIGERGGGGIELPTLDEAFLYAILFVVTKGAGTFISELVKDIYKVHVKPIFEKRNHGRGRIAFKFTTDYQETLNYIFPEYLEEDECYDALIQLGVHFETMNIQHNNLYYCDFIFDRKLRQWQIF